MGLRFTISYSSDIIQWICLCISPVSRADNGPFCHVLVNIHESKLGDCHLASSCTSPVCSPWAERGECLLTLDNPPHCPLPCFLSSPVSAPGPRPPPRHSTEGCFNYQGFLADRACHSAAAARPASPCLVCPCPALPRVPMPTESPTMGHWLTRHDMGAL